MRIKKDSLILFLIKYSLILSLISVFILSPIPNRWGFKVFAENESVSEENLSAVAERQALEAELKKLEEQAEQIQGDITKTQAEKKTLQNQIYILKKKIEQLNLQIKQSNIMIKDITLQIVDTKSSITKTASKIESSKVKLANILRTIYEEDQKSIAEILIKGETISSFFDNLVALETLNSKNKEFLEEIKNLKTSLEEQKDSLDSEQTDLEKTLQIQLLQKKESESTQKEKNTILEETKGKESEYQKLLTETQKKAQEIRSRIFEMIGVPQAPTFEEAYNIAKFVSGITGVRTAFLLAVITQESNIGKNVGQCYLVNLETGEGVRTTNNKIELKTMNPKRDVAPFITITKELGKDPLNSPVSCPLSSGWGGAMGPAQFIPSTWMNYREKVSDVTGKPANPWSINDAFLAAGIYLKELGASQDEFSAAMHYFSGTNWSKYEEFYGRSVLSIAKQYEEDIKTIQ